MNLEIWAATLSLLKYETNVLSLQVYEHLLNVPVQAVLGFLKYSIKVNESVYVYYCSPAAVWRNEYISECLE